MVCFAGIVFDMVGLTGLEPVTLRLSSACSNQLSYRPLLRDRKPETGNRKVGLVSGCSLESGGGMGVRTPDIQLAKLALYQLSYTPDIISNREEWFRLKLGIIPEPEIHAFHTTSKN